MRTVGVEVEFAGLEFADASRIVGDHLDVAPGVISPHEHEFEPSGPSPWRLEFDFALLKRLSREEQDSDDDALRQFAIDALDAVASVITPLELVTPPLPESDLPALHELLEKLAAAGATGTGDSPINAFGVHFNPQTSLNADSISAHLGAFLCLFDWLRDRDETDISRRVTPYIDPFPENYEREVLAPGFHPNQRELIDHYLAHNPTRNRALDMLPLFAQIDADRVAAAVDDDRVNARPTFHYRLPNSRLGEPDWSIMRPWNDWLAVEKLAANQSLLRQLSQARLAYLDQGVLTRRTKDWVEQCQKIVENL